MKHGEFCRELPWRGGEGFIETDDEAVLGGVFPEDAPDAYRRGGDAGVRWHALRLKPLLPTLRLGLLFDLDDGDGRNGLGRHLMSEADHFGLVDVAGIKDDGMRLAGEVVLILHHHLIRAAEEGLEGGREEFFLEDELLRGGRKGCRSRDEGLEEGLIARRRTLRDQKGGRIQRKEVAIAADAVGTFVVIEVLGVDEEVVEEVLLREEVRTCRIGHVKSRQAAHLIRRGGHRAVSDDRDGAHDLRGAFVIPHGLHHLELRVVLRHQARVKPVAVLVSDGGESCGGACGEPFIERLRRGVVFQGDDLSRSGNREEQQGE